MQHRIEQLVETPRAGSTERPAQEVLDSTVAQHLRWLLQGPIRTPEGMLVAWTAGGAPAHVYEESTGYLITLLCYLHQLTGDERYHEEASGTVRALTRTVGDRAGCGRDGRIYLFDTVVCLRALGTFHTLYGDHAGDRQHQQSVAVMDRLAHTARQMMERQQACSGAANGSSRRWSRSFSAHLIKAAQLMAPWLPGWRSVIEALISRYHHDGRFAIDDRHRQVYLHACCYAGEGLLAAGELSGQPSIAPFLASVQADDGGLPARWPDGDQQRVTDATAQAVRIWQCSDAQAYADNIQQGLGFLQSMAHPGGGFRYSTGVDHLNSWATIFAVQALVWRHGDPAPGWIV